MGIVWVDVDVIVASLIESIHGITNYRVKYDKAWHAKQHAMTKLWGWLKGLLCNSS